MTICICHSVWFVPIITSPIFKMPPRCPLVWLAVLVTGIYRFFRVHKQECRISILDGSAVGSYASRLLPQAITRGLLTIPAFVINCVKPFRHSVFKAPESPPPSTYSFTTLSPQSHRASKVGQVDISQATVLAFLHLVWSALSHFLFSLLRERIQACQSLHQQERQNEW